MSTFHIRAAHPDDALSMADVRVETWRATYRGIVPNAFLDGLSPQTVAEHWKKAFWQTRDSRIGVFVAENEEGEITGIAICGPEQNQDEVYESEIYVLYVRPAYQNQGIGRALVAACVDRFIHQLGAHTLLIWVIAENPYRRFYESLGGKQVREKTREIGGKMITEVGYGWEEISQLIESS